jgi:hypothetical protein
VLHCTEDALGQRLVCGIQQIGRVWLGLHSAAGLCSTLIVRLGMLRLCVGMGAGRSKSWFDLGTLRMCFVHVPLVVCGGSFVRVFLSWADSF